VGGKFKECVDNSRAGDEEQAAEIMRAVDRL